MIALILALMLRPDAVGETRLAYIDPDCGGAGVLLDANGDTLSRPLIPWVEAGRNPYMEYYNDHYGEMGISINGRFYSQPEDPSPKWWETENGRVKGVIGFVLSGLVVGFIVGLTIKWL